MLHRWFASRSDRAAERWRQAYRLPGNETLEWHHLYRAMAFPGEPLQDQPGARVLDAPRCTKDWIDEALVEQRRDLFSEIALVFFDPTSLCFEGEGGQEIGRNGKSKDHRPDLKQMGVGLALDLHGWPLCGGLWPGNTADVTTLLPVVGRFLQRFRVRRVCLVADRGMISAETVAVLESGAVDCDEEQRRKDAADRQALVEHLREQLKRGDKELIGNQGYRKYLGAGPGERFTIDEAKVNEEARYDGKWALQINLADEPKIIALGYKELWL